MKIRLVIVAPLAAVMLLCGCGGNGSGESKADASLSAAEEQTVTAAEIVTKLEDSGLCGTLDFTAIKGSEDFDGACEKLYGVPAEKLDDGAIMFVSAGTSADEVSIISSSTEDCKALLEQRRDMRKKDFEGYAPEESAKAENGRIFEYSGKWLLVISDSADKIEETLKG